MKIFFNGWDSIQRILVIGVCGYVALVLILRISGTRTLSKMNSFDFIVTIALGSTFASALLSKTVTLADAVTAFTVLVGLQYILTWFSVRSPRFDRLIKNEPKLLFASGKFLKDSMNKAHVTEEEVLAGIRSQAISNLNQVLFVVLETNGEIVAVKKEEFNKTEEKRLTLTSQVTPDPKKYS